MLNCVAWGWNGVPPCCIMGGLLARPVCTCAVEVVACGELWSLSWSCAVASCLVFPNSELLPFCQAGAASPPRELVFLHALGTGSPSPSFLSFWEVAPVNAAKTGA